MAYTKSQVIMAARRAATKYGVDPDIFVRQIGAESSFRTNLGPNSAGASGVAQFIPSTAKAYGVNLGDGKIEDDLDGAARYMRDNLKTAGGDYKKALSIYNSGRPDGYLNISETANYVNKILHGVTPKAYTGSPGKTAPKKSGGDTLTKVTLPSQTDKTTTGIDQAAYEDARKKAILGSYLAKKNPNSTLAGILGTTPPSPSDFLKTTTDTTVTPGKVQVIPGALSKTGGKASGPTTAGGKATRVKGAKAGDPVTHETSVGGTHETAGLPGYPAKDYFAPAGSAAVAPVSGKIVRFSGHDPAAGPTNGVHGPFGWSLYLQGDNGKMYFLTHMGSRSVKVGQTVKAGQKVGTVGNYSKYGGVDHIHMGVHG